MNSLILSEIEHAIIQKGSSDLNNEFESTVSKILGAYLNGEAIEIIFDDNYNLVNIKLEGNDIYYIAIDLETGLAYPVSYHDNQVYKGVFESFTGCNLPPGNLGVNLHDALRSLSDMLSDFFTLESLAGTLGGLAITAGLIAAGPLGWGVGLGLIAGGIILNAYSSGLFENDGYKKTENLVDFAVGTGLSFIGGSAGTVAKNAIKSAISGSVTKKLTHARMYKPSYHNIEFSRADTLITSVLGETRKEQAKTILLNHLEGVGISKAIKKTIPN